MMSKQLPRDGIRVIDACIDIRPSRPEVALANGDKDFVSLESRQFHRTVPGVA